MYRKSNLSGKTSCSRESGREVYRHEIKYRVSEPECETMRLRLSPLLRPDSHAKNGGYLIRSLYFDDYWDSAYHDKENGVVIRKKYRIRIYDLSDRVIHLERKNKYDKTR